MISKPITNQDMPRAVWASAFTRDQLRALAKRHGIKCGRGKGDTALNLHRGEGVDGSSKVFTVYLLPTGS